MQLTITYLRRAGALKAIDKKLNGVSSLSGDEGCWVIHCAENDDIVKPDLDRLGISGKLSLQ